MTLEIAATAGATLVSKDELFRQADVLSIHIILGSRTRGLVGAAELDAASLRSEAQCLEVI